MLYVYCPRRSMGALELVRALEARRLRHFDGMDFWDRRKRTKLNEGDAVVCWGSSVPEIEGVRVLNGSPAPLNKYQEWCKIASAGIETMSMKKSKEIGAYERGIKAGYVPRTYRHQGGADLLTPTKHPDFWSYRFNFVEEYRIHSFAGQSIRAGIKVPREGFKPGPDGSTWEPGMLHPWVRSFDGGWKITYDGFKSTATMRRIAHNAVKALELTFGAVDIGKASDGTFRVIEVNQAPGIEGGSISAYVRAIQKWLSNQPAGSDDEAPAGPEDEKVEKVIEKPKSMYSMDSMYNSLVLKPGDYFNFNMFAEE